ncbi:MAG: 30S ribosomal protein S12 methylthiotransferase RimO [Oscillospiraceae bacterium]|jgi:ribosomal protein S12 methylthiotransferase|nr:30S ribosomal protein S12 methylthiotransferase RimO [Oscillospiraceae bacterium]
MGRKIGMVCLGCPKNQMNAERMLALLEKAGFTLTDNVYTGADAVIVNTCGFIDDAKKEAVESILEMAELKTEGTVKKIIVTGCLAESYRAELAQEIPEVDAVLGLGANDEIAVHVQAVLRGEKREEYPPLSCLALGGARKRGEDAGHWAYLQIADGCDNHCSYCKIPDIRGKFRSRTMEEVIDEAEGLAAQGVRELVLIAQDTTCYGLDLYGQRRLPALLRQLCAIEAIRWIRLLYCYPDEISDELIDVIVTEEKVVKYIDLPLQHIDDRVLRSMKRRGDSQGIRAVLSKLRDSIPGIAIRTTFITGFPGEDEAAFELLSAFVEEQRFAHMGVFAFSPQEGTPAYKMPGQIDPAIAQARAQILTQQQAEIAARHQQSTEGQTLRVMVETYDTYTDSYVGRSEAEAPEIDGDVLFTSARHLQAGDVVSVAIFGMREDSLLGREEL